MKLISENEFNNLSVKEKQSYLIGLVNELSDEQAKELYENLIKQDDLSELFRNLEQEN